ncbi:MAG: dockerin type I domain-containing protein, partial [Canidatus Methanoxibalbensis ujae]|nr:dockerin type I domain-containing protein [Candidatus Methanoxibalbensis ujae]
GDNKVDWSDCTLLMNNVTYPGDPSYALKTSRWAADVTGDNKVDWSDCTLLMNNVTYPGDPSYGLKCS